MLVKTRQKNHDYSVLIHLFNACFAKKYNTILVKGNTEPLYLPAANHCTPAQIIFAHGYYASALHEISHWLIAGKQRRTIIDYGYWYQPDGRSAEQQSEFQQVEAKPQALEWILSTAAGFSFNLSLDNLNGDKTDPSIFKQAVINQVYNFLNKGLSRRAQIFHKALCDFYLTQNTLNLKNFEIEQI